MKRKTKFNLLYLTVVVVALYTLSGFFLIPWIVKSQMLKRLPGLLNREVSLEKVSFNPYTLTGRLQQFQIIDLDGQTFFSLEEFKGNFQISSVFRRGFSFKEVSLQEPYIFIGRNAEAVLNFADLIPQSTDSKAATTEEDKSLPIFLIKNFRVNAGILVIQDASPNSHYHKEIRDITFAVDDLSTEPEKTGLFSVSAASEFAETFTWTGELSLNPLSFSGNMVIDSLELPKFMPYVEHLLAGKVESGEFFLSLDYEIKPEQEGIDLILSNGSLSLNHLSFRNHEAQEALIGWEALRVGNFSMDLLSGQVSIDSIALNGTNLLVHRHKDGSLNLVKAYIPPSQELSPSGNTNPSPADSWSFSVSKIHVSETSLHMLDDSLSTPADLMVEIPTFQVLHLSNSKDLPFEASLKMKNTLDGNATLSGQGILVPASGEFKVELANWDLSVLNPYISEFTNIELLGGFFSMDGSLAFSMEGNIPKDLSFTGGLDLSDFVSRESTGGTPLTSWSNLAIKGIQFDYPAMQLDINSIDYLNPKVGIIIRENGSINIASLLKPVAPQAQPLEKETPISDPPANSREMGITVDTFSINNGYFSFEDLQQTPHVLLASEEITGMAKGLSSDLSARPSFSLNTQVMGITPLNMEGELNLLASQPYVNLTIILKGLEMTPFAPYFSRYVGYYLEKGLLNLDLSYRVEEQQLEAENQVVVNQLSLGEPTSSPDATSLPVPLAVSLLKDASGDIIIDVPIRGDLSDPEFKLGGVILKTISNLILKLATSPFNMLAKLANVSAEELQIVTFKQGNAELNEHAMTNLDALALVMEERPGIRLEISVSIDPSVETPALIKNRLMAQLEINFEIEPGLDLPEGEQYQIRIEQAYRKERPLVDILEDLPPFHEMESTLLASIPFTDNDLNQLALQRKQSIRNYLVSEKAIAPERILIVEDQSLELNDSGISIANLSIK